MRTNLRDRCDAVSGRPVEQQDSSDVIDDPNDDAAFERGLAAPSDARWYEFFAFDTAREEIDDGTPGFHRWYELAYDLGVVQPFPWMEWIEAKGARFVSSRDLADASLADAIRIVTAIVRSDRFSEGHLVNEMGGGLVTGAVQVIQDWYQRNQ
jgi:hypothetical protein